MSAGTVAPEFAPWRDALGRMRPAYYRLLLDWASLQPDPGRPLALENPSDGCQRAAPCAGWNGLRDQLRALASRQRAGGWEGVAVISGTPGWAASPPGGCERAGTQPRSRPPTAAGVAGYRRMVDAVLAAAQREGASLRYWSAWNEPNHPYGFSPQRETCTPGAPSVAARTYAGLARALQDALDAAPGQQEQVLGELAALDERKPQSTPIEEFLGRLPRTTVCRMRVFAQHGYVDGFDPTGPVERAVRGFRCGRPFEVWMTETGVGAPGSGRTRSTTASAQRRECRALHRRLTRWWEDDRVTVAFQYTLREDPVFPTGLVATSLQAAYPALREWQAWGGGRRPADAPPARAC